MVKATPAGKRAHKSKKAALSLSIFGTALLISPMAQANPLLEQIETDASQVEAVQMDSSPAIDFSAIDSSAIDFSAIDSSGTDLITDNSLDSLKADAVDKPLSPDSSERAPLRGSDRLLELQQARIRREQLRARLFPNEQITPEAVSSTEANHNVYLYGQQPVANQLGTASFEFEAREEIVSGAFYMPGSSFDCASGYMSQQAMELTITDSYSQETHQYALGLTAPTAVVASGQGVALPTGIEGFHPLPVTERDRTILAICQARR